jgi:methylmalonyl-CoA mutase N-terminal domain/subunit
LRDRYGARTPEAQRLRFHTQTAGVSLTAQQPMNNVVRTAVEALAAVLGGTQSLHTNALDEVLALPTEAAATLALRTQQVIAYETGVAAVADPLGGSYYVEALTDEMEGKIREVIARIDAAGGMYAAVEAGIPQQICGDSALAFAQKIDSGAETIVGVNKYRLPAEEDAEREALRPPPRKKIEAQLKRLKRFKAGRDQGAVRRALDALARAAASEDENVFEKVVDAACAGVTHGEICAELRKVYGFGSPLIVP